MRRIRMDANPITPMRTAPSADPRTPPRHRASRRAAWCSRSAMRAMRTLRFWCEGLPERARDAQVLLQPLGDVPRQGHCP